MAEERFRSPERQRGIPSEQIKATNPFSAEAIRSVPCGIAIILFLVFYPCSYLCKRSSREPTRD